MRDPQVVADEKREGSACLPDLPPEIELHLGSHHGLATVSSLHALGASRQHIERWIGQGWLERRPGRLLVGQHRVDQWSALMAISLRSPTSAFGMATAAALHGLDAYDDHPLWPPTVLNPRGGRPMGGRLVHCDVPSSDIVLVEGLRVTNVTRTLVDLGAFERSDSVERALECALRTGLVVESGLNEVLERLAKQGKAGPPVLAAILERRGAGTIPTDSDAETRFLQIVRRPDLPEPTRQQAVTVDGRRLAKVDFAFAEAPQRPRLWIEIDGASVHAGPQALTRDLRRQNQLMRSGPGVLLRFSGTDIYGHPAYVRQETWHHLGLDQRM